jgi:arsenate reductase-like glutaredoxin family protein|tara:strand:- start:313 stop:618 length:306 start_codon:yes stop_codon:yes gene_type:complete
MYRNKYKLINASDKPVLATLVSSFLEKSEDEIRKVAAEKNRQYKTLTSACRQGLAYKSLAPAFIKALDESIIEAVAADTKECGNKLREDSMKNTLKQYFML